jgi:hypothetical protein
MVEIFNAELKGGKSSKFGMTFLCLIVQQIHLLPNVEHSPDIVCMCLHLISWQLPLELRYCLTYLKSCLVV